MQLQQVAVVLFVERIATWNAFSRTGVQSGGNFPSRSGDSFKQTSEGARLQCEKQLWQHAHCSQALGPCSRDSQVTTLDAASFQDSQIVGVHNANDSSSSGLQSSQLDEVAEPLRARPNAPRRLVVRRIKGSSRFSVDDASQGAPEIPGVKSDCSRVSENISQGVHRQANSPFARLIEMLDQ